MASTSKKKRSPLRGKGALVGLAVLIVLGIWLSIDLKKPVRDPDTMPPVSDFTGLNSEDVRRVELKRASGGFTLVRNGKEWAFEAPRSYRANPESVNNWLKGLLENATVSQAMETRPSELAKYGLDKPAYELVLTGRDGKARTLQVGKDFRPEGGSTPGSIFYARDAADRRLFMLSSMQVDDLKNKKVQDLRDKRLLDLGEEKEVQKIVIQRAAGSLEIQRRGEDKWDMVQPFPAPAEKFDVENLLSQLRSSEADSFAEDSAPDLARYGLDRPRMTVQVTEKSGQKGILFGKDAKDSKVYASRQGGGEVLLVAKSTFESLDKKPADLRERKLVTLDKDKITSVELKNSHGSTRLQKSGGNEWQIANAADPKQAKAKGDVAQRILDTVTGSAAKHVEEGPKDLKKYGLETPIITVRVNEGTGTTQVFSLGAKTKDGNYYAKGQPNAVFEVYSYAFADLNVRPDAFVDKAKK